MNENELPDALRESLPPRPNAKGWADGARRKARNRRVAASSVALIAGAALIIPLAGQLTRNDTIVATPAPTATAPADAPESLPWLPSACLDPDADALPLVDDDLPDGALRMWLCGRNPADPGWLVGSVGAPDTLDTDVDEVVAEFNAMDKSEGVLDCMPNPLDYTVVVDYPDGHRTLRVAGCGDLRDATDMSRVFRADGEGFLAGLAERWDAKRAENGWSWRGTDVCSMRATSAWGPVDPAELTRAVACGPNPTEIPTDLAGRLIASFQELDAPRPEEIGLGGPPTLVLLTPAGDPISLVDWMGYGWNDGQSNRAWPIPDDLRSELNGYLQQAGEAPSPAPTPELPDERTGSGLEPKVCEDIRSGALPADDLPGTENLPTGVARAWLCGDSAGFGGIGPIEPLITDPDRIVDAINALPATQSQACTAVGGPTYNVALDYPDGTRRVVSMETVNCGFVGGWGGRDGGPGLVDQVTEMWLDQREASPTPFTDEVSLCKPMDRTNYWEPVTSFMLPVERAELVRGAVCGLPSDAAGFDEEVVEIALPSDILMAIAQEDVLDESEPSIRYPGQPYLVLLNQFGDPMVASVQAGGGGVLLDAMGLEPEVWTPTAGLADLWRETLAPLRLDPFYAPPLECQGYNPDDITGDLATVVSGVACLHADATPSKGPELEPEFAAEIASRFDAEAVPDDWGAGTDISLFLRDADGELARLYWDYQKPPRLSDGERFWPIPDDIRAELEQYGFDFTIE